ncbi:hypothetical protein ASC89_09200 [Devosia sp. Root413D1]|uniref:DUF1214 domain-containing protein n=1 Tax=unclassified Devosia TaxID=196773 RepID=UPI0006FDBD36|nr:MULTISPECIES: DUF1214 domain-containing protein [unclassified Devosia]KQU94154.1 hypothetical protein ASC68_21055 [Devosia sp. Root105]KQW80260.1 hypothetical protein ASC89_09200 [Devosia sp. Root413D1]
MRFLVHLGSMLLVALLVGFGLSWYALSDGRLFGAIEIGPWSAWRDVGVPAPDPYTRAFIARSGALELGASEGIQFIATTDSDNRRLDRACRYRIDGTTPAARFWTLVPVAPGDGAPITRADGPTDFHSARLSRAGDGSVELYVSKTLAPQNWLEITGDGAFDLVLTLYDTSSLSGVGADVAALPSIIREACA